MFFVSWRGVNPYQIISRKKKGGKEMGKGVDCSILKELWEKNYTITTQLYRNLQKWPDKPAIIDPLKRTMTFRQWDEEAISSPMPFSMRDVRLLIPSWAIFITAVSGLLCTWAQPRQDAYLPPRISCFLKARSPDSWMIVR